MYIDKLDDIVNRCNNTYHRTLKMKYVYLKKKSLVKKIMKKILNLKLVMLLEYQNIKKAAF